MYWKELFKHSLKLYGLYILVGFSVLLYFSTINPLITPTPALITIARMFVWIEVITMFFVLPFIYSYFVKKTNKEWLSISAMLTLIFIAIHQILYFIISVYFTSITNSTIGGFYLIRHLFNSSPVWTVSSAFCPDIFECFLSNNIYLSSFIILLSFFIIINVVFVISNKIFKK